MQATAAPAALVAGAHRAAIDEIDHAKLCFGIATRFGGEAAAPAAFPIKNVTVSSNLTDMLLSVIHEGCIHESLSAARAAQQQELADDPAVKAAFAKIADDEGR